MPVDPQIQALLDKGAGVPATHTLPVDRARTQYESRIPLMGKAAPVAAVVERHIAGPGGDGLGGALGLRIYTPLGAGPFPLMVFYHGSGFVLCSLDTHDGLCRNLCAGGGCVVVSVDYRLAPEAKFPAAPDDCLMATHWAAEHAVELNADPSRIVVAGDSAGGNLAAVTALRIRDEGARAARAIVAVSSHRLPHAGHAILRRERRGLRPDARDDGMVLGPLPRRQGGRRASPCVAVARARSVRAAGGLCDERRIRSPARRG
jgi:acetyl esterase/lipase